MRIGGGWGGGRGVHIGESITAEAQDTFSYKHFKI